MIAVVLVIAAIVFVFVFVLLLVLGLCRVAALGDQQTVYEPHEDHER